jgi:hypothetical protein
MLFTSQVEGRISYSSQISEYYPFFMSLSSRLSSSFFMSFSRHFFMWFFSSFFSIIHVWKFFFSSRVCFSISEVCNFLLLLLVIGPLYLSNFNSYLSLELFFHFSSVLSFVSSLSSKNFSFFFLN